jgi:ABC-type polysaccharide/polyol phosphate transport system ATPase subunit
MSLQTAITVKSLSKSYKLYHSRYDRMKEFFHPLRKTFHRKHDALKNVSFDLKRGEVLGIIGENGSGKSTLLKILNSVVSPTSGGFSSHGRITALLELGGGFNNDLTGIENLFYLGAIQGYSKKEMKSKIDQILDFADIGEYAYQPVNTYSSGMYVRLAFSMAINIDPDILITDEALSVGDIRFQQKCFRKIREFKDLGKTILICTHSLSVVKDFCTRAIWLHEGEIREQGDPVFVADCYNAYMLSSSSDLTINNSIKKSLKGFEMIYPTEAPDLIWQNLNDCDNYGTGKIDMKYAALVERKEFRTINELKGGEPVRIFLMLKALDEIYNPGVQLTLNGDFSNSVMKIMSYYYKIPLRFKTGITQIVAVDFDFPHIGNGRYSFSFGISSIIENEEQQIQWVHDALIVQVSNQEAIYRNGALIVISKATFKVLE